MNFNKIKILFLLFFLVSCESPQDRIKNVDVKKMLSSPDTFFDKVKDIYNSVKNSYVVNRIPDYVNTTPQSIVFLMKEDSYQGYYFVKNYIDNSNKVKDFKNKLKYKIDDFKPSQVYKNTVMQRFNK